MLRLEAAARSANSRVRAALQLPHNRWCGLQHRRPFCSAHKICQQALSAVHKPPPQQAHTWWPSTGASTAADHSFRVTPLSADSCRRGQQASLASAPGPRRSTPRSIRGQHRTRRKPQRQAGGREVARRASMHSPQRPPGPKCSSPLQPSPPMCCCAAHLLGQVEHDGQLLVACGQEALRARGRRRGRQQAGRMSSQHAHHQRRQVTAVPCSGTAEPACAWHPAAQPQVLAVHHFGQVLDTAAAGQCTCTCCL